MPEKENKSRDWLDPDTHVEGLERELRFARDKDHKAQIQSELDRIRKRTTVTGGKETR